MVYTILAVGFLAPAAREQRFERRRMDAEALAAHDERRNPTCPDESTCLALTDLQCRGDVCGRERAQLAGEIVHGGLRPVDHPRAGKAN